MPIRYFIGLTLPPQLSSYIDTWRKQYDPNSYKKVAPHITVKSPFYLKQEEKDLVQEITQLLKRHKYFKINVRNFGSFNRHSYVMFANVQLSDSLLQLHQEIVQTVKPLLDPTSSRPEYEPYHPHITIANHLNDSDYLKLSNSLTSINLSQTFTVNQVSIFRKEGEGAYQIAHQIKLDN